VRSGSRVPGSASYFRSISRFACAII
jgi:hypothetical protein